MAGVAETPTDTAHRSFRRLLAQHGIAVVVLLVMFAATTVGGLTAQRIVHDQERRLLNQRATEVAAYLTSSVGAIRVALVSVGSAATIKGSQPADLAKIAGSTSVPGGALVVEQQTAGQFRQLAGIGDARVLASITGNGQKPLAQRALGSTDLVTNILPAPAGAYLLVAVRIPSALATVAVWATPIQPNHPTPPAADSPYRDLNVAVYAAATADPKSLLLTSGVNPTSASGSVQHSFTVGSQPWLLIANPRASLVGSLASKFPWTIVIVGGVLSIVIALLVDVLTRRRSYALNLVNQRTQTLQNAQAAAETANMAKSEFLSRMSHELRTPLNAVLGFSQVLEMDELTESQQDSVNQIIKGGQHLLNLINEVLDISHIEAGKLSLSPEAVHVSELIGETVDLMRPLAQDRSIHLLSPRAQCEEFIFTDRQRMKQILLNLISNAIKYNRQGGSVSIRCAEVAEHRLRVLVTDTGPGIAASQMPLLFTPFERLGAEQTSVEGTGIGLALSRKLAESLGGSLGVESDLGKGSTFWVEFPIVEGPVDRYERLHPSSEIPATVDYFDPVKVLYIEDNLSNLKLVERVLAQRPQIELISAMQGQLGLDLAREHQPVLVLLDLNLADLPGDEILRRLRDDPGTANIPVVIISADATPRHVQRLLSAGALAYLTKPIDVQKLLGMIDRAAVAIPRSRQAANS